MPVVHLVHGFRVRDGGRHTTDLLRPFFQSVGLSVVEHDYGWRGLLGVRFCNQLTSEVIAARVRVGDVGCGHSNGCLLLLEASKRGAAFDGLVLINPALEPDVEFPPHVRWVHVYHNRGDLAVRASKALDLLPWNWGAGHPWGVMGATGYTGNDRRVTNIDCSRGRDPVNGHSDIFRKLAVWGSRIASATERAVWPTNPQARGGAA